jgi:hypothetical protein
MLRAVMPEEVRSIAPARKTVCAHHPKPMPVSVMQLRLLSDARLCRTLATGCSPQENSERCSTAMGLQRYDRPGRTRAARGQEPPLACIVARTFGRPLRPLSGRLLGDDAWLSTVQQGMALRVSTNALLSLCPHHLGVLHLKLETKVRGSTRSNASSR